MLATVGWQESVLARHLLMGGGLFFLITLYCTLEAPPYQMTRSKHLHLSELLVLFHGSVI